MDSVVVRQAVFTLGMVVLGFVEAGLASLLGWRGANEILGSIALCLIPGWMTIFAGELLRFRDLSAFIILVGMGLRVMFVLIGLLAVAMFIPGVGLREFAIWLVVGYLVALVLETWLVLLPASKSSS